MNNSDVTVNEQEDSFSKFYASELRKNRQQINNNVRGFNVFEDESSQVFQQAIRTPGRRGEVIKKEEIEKEFTRRFKADDPTYHGSND
jgi:hypothetical protein